MQPWGLCGYTSEGSEGVTRSTEGMVALQGDVAGEEQPSHSKELT